MNKLIKHLTPSGVKKRLHVTGEHTESVMSFENEVVMKNHLTLNLRTETWPDFSLVPPTPRFLFDRSSDSSTSHRAFDTNEYDDII